MGSLKIVYVALVLGVIHLGRAGIVLNQTPLGTVTTIGGSMPSAVGVGGTYGLPGQRVVGVGGVLPGGVYPGGVYPGGVYPGGVIPGSVLPGGVYPGGVYPGTVPGVNYPYSVSQVSGLGYGGGLPGTGLVVG